MSVAGTVDSLHVFYPGKVLGFNKNIHRRWDAGAGWSGFIEYTFDWGGYYYNYPLMKSSGNDLFVVYRYNIDNSYIMLRQYDVVPLAPQNVEMGTHKVGSTEYYPRPFWPPSREADIESYKVHRRMQGAGSFSYLATVTHPATEYIDYSFQTGSLDTAFYRITAVDTLNHESDPSNIVFIKTNSTSAPSVSGFQQLTLVVPREFGLMPNFPNPFNPSTLIMYEIPRETHVTLNVYDVLGQEVRALVDETKPAGYHEVTLDASTFASGVYFYKIIAGEFVAVRKLVVMK